MDTEIDHVADEHGGRYTLLLDGEAIGELDHVDSDGVRTFTHTGVRPAYEGKGLAARLVRRGLDDARDAEMEIVPACPYVAAYLTRHGNGE
jgi:predicted GNAT family acetyltransferase